MEDLLYSGCDRRVLKAGTGLVICFGALLTGCGWLLDSEAGVEVLNPLYLGGLVGFTGMVLYEHQQHTLNAGCPAGRSFQARFAQRARVSGRCGFGR